VNVHDNKIWHKRVRPTVKQGDFESRRLWQHVTNALRVGDINTATEHKKFVSIHRVVSLYLICGLLFCSVDFVDGGL